MYARYELYSPCSAFIFYPPFEEEKLCGYDDSFASINKQVKDFNDIILPLPVYFSVKSAPTSSSPRLETTPKKKNLMCKLISNGEMRMPANAQRR